MRWITDENGNNIWMATYVIRKNNPDLNDVRIRDANGYYRLERFVLDPIEGLLWKAIKDSDDLDKLETIFNEEFWSDKKPKRIY